jgi:hypothetical protein
MADTTIITDAQVTIDGTDLSSVNTDVALTRSANVVEIPASMGEEDVKRAVVSRDWGAVMTFRVDDYSTLSVVEDSYEAMDPVTVTVSGSSAAIDASHPEWSGDAVISEIQPLGGGFGDANAYEVTVDGHGALTRTDSTV